MKTRKVQQRLRAEPGGSNLLRVAEILFLLFAVACIVALPTISARATSPSRRLNAVKPQETPIPTPADSGHTGSEAVDGDQEKDETKKPKRGSLIFAPIPISSPAFGSGLILGVGYVFKLKMNDKASPPSTLGLATAFTNSGTRGVALGGKLYFSENKYQTTFAFGKGRANYKFFGIGHTPGQEPISVEIKQSGTIFFGEFMRNFGKRIFVGPRYQYRKLTATLGGTTTPGGFEIPAIDVHSTTAAIGFKVQRDTTGGSFYPRSGSLFNFTGDFFAKPLGSNRNYQTYKLAYNGYHGVGEKQVIAYRAMTCAVTDTAPFFDLCLYGTSSDLRGYTTGEFQNRRMFATQVEYRRELPYRFGVVGFAGVGGVARRWNEFQFNKLLPAAGVGLRFKLDKTNHINYRVDLGFGRTGPTLSLSVTEAF